MDEQQLFAVFGTMCRGIVAAAFVWSGSSKLLSSERFAGVLRAFPITRSLISSQKTAQLAALTLGLTESLLGLLYFLGLGMVLVSVALTTLLVVFTGMLGSAVIRGEQISCGCFGTSGKPVTWGTVARNLTLLSLVLSGAYLAPGPLGTSVAAGDPGSPTGLTLVLSLQASLMTVLLVNFAQLRSRSGYVSRVPQLENSSLGAIWQGAPENSQAYSEGAS